MAAVQRLQKDKEEALSVGAVSVLKINSSLCSFRHFEPCCQKSATGCFSSPDEEVFISHMMDSNFYLKTFLRTEALLSAAWWPLR